MRTLIAAVICLLPMTAQAAHKHGPKHEHHRRDDAVAARPHHRVHLARHHRRPSLPAVPDRQVAKLQNELEKFRLELAEVKATIGRPPDEPVGWQRSLVVGPSITPPPRRLDIALSLPDLRQPDQTPAQPVPMPERVTSAAVDEARRYLIDTAYPGYTMSRQGPDVALGRLHPEFQVRLAALIHKARSLNIAAGIFSAYRPPAFGVGGFLDKFNSLHSYGLAVDMAGIGSPGSRTARLFAQLVATSGLYLPYGPSNGAEWNHVQLIPAKMAAARLRGTITASAPRDLTSMWAASGVAVPLGNPPTTEAKR